MERVVRSKLFNFLGWQILFWILFFVFYPQLLANAKEILAVRILVVSAVIGLCGIDTAILLNFVGKYFAG